MAAFLRLSSTAFDNISYQQSRLQKQIENWKNRGYDISMKDFEFKEPSQ